MKRKKILFVSYYYPPAAGQALPGTQRSVKFIRYMDRFEKYVMTVRPELYPGYFTLDHPASLPVNGEQVVRTEVYDIFQFLVKVKNRVLFRQKGSGADESEQYTGSSACSGVCGNGNAGTFQKLKDIVSAILTYPDEANCWILPAVRKGRKLIKQEGVDYVFATGKPWSALIVAFFLKRKGVQLVVDFRDPWVNNPFETEISGVRKAVDKFLEKKVVRKADRVLLNTEDLREEFRERYPTEPKEKFITMTNGYDAADFAASLQAPKDVVVCEDRENLVLTHAGLLYGLRDPIAVFKALDRYYQQYKENPGVHVIFRQLGDITLDYNYQDYLQFDSEVQVFDNVGQVPYSECLGYLSRSDVLLIIQPDTKTQIPSKLFEYIFLNKPILTIAPLDGALAAMIKQYGFGEIYDPSDVEGILAYFHEKVKEKKEKGYLRCDYTHRERFDIKNITADFEQLLLDGAVA